MTQSDFRDLLGVLKAQISKLENNTKDFRIGTILRALEALGAKVKIDSKARKESANSGVKKPELNNHFTSIW